MFHGYFAFTSLIYCTNFLSKFSCMFLVTNESVLQHAESFACNYLKLNLIGFNNLNVINLSSYSAFRFVHFFFAFLVELHTQRLQSLRYTEFSLIRIPKTIPTCFTTQTFLAFDVYKRESSNINLSFHKQLKEALG